MRPWLAPFAAAALLCAFASPSFAAFAHGLEFSAVGSAVVTSCPNEQCLEVSNLDSPGSAVDISLYRSSGHHLSFSSNWDATTHDGSQLTFEWSCTSGTCQCAPGYCSSSLSMMRTSSGVSVSGSWSTGAVYVYSLYRGDELLSTSSSSDHLLSFDGLSSSSAIPSVDIETDGKRDLVLYSVTFPSLVTLSGSPLLCDRVVITIVAQDNIVELDECRISCSSPPGSSCLSSLTISSQSLYVMGTMLTSVDAMHFSPPPSSSVSLFTFVGALASPTSMIAFRASPLSIVSSHGGGGGGGGCASGECSSFSSSRPSSLTFPPGSLVLRPGVDVGASVRCDITGSSSCSPDGVLASMTALVQSSDILLSSRFSSMCADAESVIVSNDGVVVLRQAVALDGSVTISPRPGSSSSVSVSSVQAYTAKQGKTGKTKVTEDIGGDTMRLPSVVVARDQLTCTATLSDGRTICVGGTCVIGDEVSFVGHRLSSGGPTLTLDGTVLYVTRSSSSQEPDGFVVQDVSTSSGDQVSALSSSSAITLSSSVVQVPVVIERTDTTPARGYSVTLQLSNNLYLAGGMVEWDYLSESGNTQMFVTPEGNGRYTVDCVLLGPGCGPTEPSGSSTLFTVPVSAAPGATDGTGTVSIESVTLASCINDPLPCTTGGSAYVVIDRVSPGKPTATATQVTTGNAPGSTTAIRITSDSILEVDESFEVYVAAHGTGPAPVAPTTYPPTGPWSLLTLPPVSAPGSYQLCYSTNGGACWTQQSSTRDHYYFVIVLKDQYGNASPISDMTTGTNNFHLGDNTDGVSTCSGDNHVDGADMSYLGSLYGAVATPATQAAIRCADHGPTSDHHVTGRPLYDNRLNFQDLILMAINFSLVSTPADRTSPVAAASNSVRLLPATIPAVGSTFDAVLAMSGAGDIQGLSTQLDYDRAVLELVSASSGELLGRQDRGGVVLTEGGRVDAALLGEGGGIAGEGELARVRFRVRAAGDARLGITGVDARDVQNREVAVGLLSSPAPPVTRTAIRYAYPDPFDRQTRVEFTLAQRAPVKIGVFDVAGRHVRTLLQGVQDAGVQSVDWDGRDDSGARRQAGVYLIRFEAAGARETRTVRLVP